MASALPVRPEWRLRHLPFQGSSQGIYATSRARDRRCSRDAQPRALKVESVTHHALGVSDQAGLWISRAEGREALGVRLDPVEIEHGRIVLVGQMAVEPQGDGSGRLLRQFDELLAAD